MKATFQNTVDILVKAYLNDTLRHGNCNACAVGNILRSADWMRLFFTDTNYTPAIQLLVPGPDYIVAEGQNDYGTYKVIPLAEARPYRVYQHELALQLVKNSGYTITDLARIEYAFETAPKGKDDDEWMFNGLMAVVDVLADIHGIDLEQKESAKALFVKA